MFANFQLLSTFSGTRFPGSDLSVLTNHSYHTSTIALLGNSNFLLSPRPLILWWHCGFFWCHSAVRSFQSLGTSPGISFFLMSKRNVYILWNCLQRSLSKLSSKSINHFKKMYITNALLIFSEHVHRRSHCRDYLHFNIVYSATGACLTDNFNEY